MGLVGLPDVSAPATSSGACKAHPTSPYCITFGRFVALPQPPERPISRVAEVVVYRAPVTLVDHDDSAIVAT